MYTFIFARPMKFVSNWLRKCTNFSLTVIRIYGEADRFCLYKVNFINKKKKNKNPHNFFKKTSRSLPLKRYPKHHSATHLCSLEEPTFPLQVSPLELLLLFLCNNMIFLERSKEGSVWILIKMMMTCPYYLFS